MILLTLVGYFTYTRIAEVDVLLAQRGNSLARQLAPGTEFALFAGDNAALDRLAKAAVREADVAGVTITDARAASSPLRRPESADARRGGPIHTARPSDAASKRRISRADRARQRAGQARRNHRDHVARVGTGRSAASCCLLGWASGRLAAACGRTRAWASETASFNRFGAWPGPWRS